MVMQVLHAKSKPCARPNYITAHMCLLPLRMYSEPRSHNSNPSNVDSSRVPSNYFSVQSHLHRCMHGKIGSILREGQRRKASRGMGDSKPMDKMFNAYLVYFAANEIISLQRKIRVDRLPNRAVDTIINGVTSVAPIITKNMIMRKLTRMEKAKKEAVAPTPQAQFLSLVRIHTLDSATKAAGYADGCAMDVTTVSAEDSE